MLPHASSPEAETKRAWRAQNSESFPMGAFQSSAKQKHASTPHAALTTLVGKYASHGCRVLFATSGLAVSTGRSRRATTNGTATPPRV
jgi:hypothetical protein